MRWAAFVMRTPVLTRVSNASGKHAALSLISTRTAGSSSSMVAVPMPSAIAHSARPEWNES